MRTLRTLAFLLSVLPAAAGLSAPAAAETHAFCGGGDAIFCGNTASFARETAATLHFWHSWRAVAAELIRRRPAVIKLAGESCGCTAAVEVAHALKAAGLKVAKLACFDGARILCSRADIPANVASTRHWRQDGGLGGARLTGRNVREFTFQGLSHLEIAGNRAIRTDARAFMGGR